MWDRSACRYIKSLHVWYTEGSGGTWPSSTPSNLTQTSLSLSLSLSLPSGVCWASDSYESQFALTELWRVE